MNNRYRGLGSANSGLQSHGPQRFSLACRIATWTCIAGMGVFGLLLFRFSSYSTSPFTLLPPHSISSPPSSTAAPNFAPASSPETFQAKCAAASKLLRQRGGWDYMRVMRGGQASVDSVVHQGNLNRLHKAIARANAEERPLKIAVLGGSFSAGGAVADMEDSFPEVLASLLAGKEEDGGDGPIPSTPVQYGAEIVNMAQGGAGFMLPLFCTMKVYSLVAEAPEQVPDVWIVEFGENFDSSVEQYEALLAMLLFDHNRFGQAAVLTAAVAKNFCWWSDGPIRASQCGLQRTWVWLEGVAQRMAVPLVSFVHGVAPWVNYRPPAWVESVGGEGGARDRGRTLPGLLLGNTSELSKQEYPGLYDKLDRVEKQLYADCGENQHFNEYGHRLLGHFLYGVFVEAGRNGGREESEEEIMTRLSPQAVEVFHRVSSGSEGYTLSCNLTLTQGRALDLIPTARYNYTLWSEKAEGSSNIFSGGKKTRTDRKQTWSPLSENATLDFDFTVPRGASTLCVLMYGSQGMFLDASFPDHPQRMVEEVNGGSDVQASSTKHDEKNGGQEDGLCRHVQPDGKITVVACGSSVEKNTWPSTPHSLRTNTNTVRNDTQSSASSSKVSKDIYRHPDGSPSSTRVNSTCVFRGGVDWTIYSVYKIDCSCLFPQGMADGGVHRIQLKNTKGKVQVAGVVIW